MTEPNHLSHFSLLTSNTQFPLTKNIPLLNNMGYEAKRTGHQNKFFPTKFMVPFLSAVTHITTTQVCCYVHNTGYEF